MFIFRKRYEIQSTILLAIMLCGILLGVLASLMLSAHAQPQNSLEIGANLKVRSLTIVDKGGHEVAALGVMETPGGSSSALALYDYTKGRKAPYLVISGRLAGLDGLMERFPLVMLFHHTEKGNPDGLCAFTFSTNGQPDFVIVNKKGEGKEVELQGGKLHVVGSHEVDWEHLENYTHLDSLNGSP